MNQQERDELLVRELFSDHVDQLPVPSQQVASTEIDPSGSSASSETLDRTPPVEGFQAPQKDLSVTPALGTDTYVPTPGRPFKNTAFAQWEVMLALKLRKEGHTFQQIADRLERSPAGVHDVIHEWAPTEDLAKATLRRGALTLAERVVTMSGVDQALEVLDRLDVLPKRERDTGGNKVQVVIGLDTEQVAPRVLVTEVPHE